MNSSPRIIFQAHVLTWSTIVILQLAVLYAHYQTQLNLPYSDSHLAVYITFMLPGLILAIALSGSGSVSAIFAFFIGIAVLFTFTFLVHLFLQLIWRRYTSFSSRSDITHKAEQGAAANP